MADLGRRPAVGRVGTGYKRLVLAVLVLVAFVCAAFTAAASAILIVLLILKEPGREPALVLRLALKGVFFLCVTAAAFGLLRRMLHGLLLGDRPSARAVPERGWPERAALTAVLLATAFLVLPRIAHYPKAEPDELHHLIVARNLAEYGRYASGHPDRDFVDFDPYDSVGPAVIGPVAGAFRVAGDTLEAGRVAMGLFFLLLCGAVYVFSRPLCGARAAVVSAALVTMAWGSVYLGRTLYGEAPALLFLVVSLIFWRHALEREQVGAFAVAAGAAFGLAILSKPFVLVVAWPLLGTYAFDRLTFRRIHWRHIAEPAAGCLAICAAWWLVKALCRQDAAAAATDTLAYYRHYLMFGIRSTGGPLTWIVSSPTRLLGALAGLAALAAATPVVFHRHYDPPAVVLFLAAPFLAYWWVGFTDGHIPRYTWYSWAIAGVFGGPLLYALAARALRGPSGASGRLLYGVLALLVAAAPAAWTLEQVKLVYTADEMQDDRALAEYVAEYPTSVRIATTHWPVQRALNFLSARNTTVLEAIPEGLGFYDMIVVDKRVQPNLLEGQCPDKAIGRYAILRSGAVAEVTEQPPSRNEGHD